MLHRYRFEYGRYGYIVWDSKKKCLAWKGGSKSEGIAEAQTLNGFSPVDGDERTYDKQVSDYLRRKDDGRKS